MRKEACALRTALHALDLWPCYEHAVKCARPHPRAPAVPCLPARARIVAPFTSC